MFDQQVITSRGLFLLNQLKTQMDARLSFVGVLGSDERVPNEQLYRLEPYQMSDWTQGTLFKVYPTKYNQLNDTRIAVSFDDNGGEGRAIKSIALIAQIIGNGSSDPTYAQATIADGLIIRAKHPGSVGNEYSIHVEPETDSPRLGIFLRRNGEQLGYCFADRNQSIEDLNASELLADHVEFVGNIETLFDVGYIEELALTGGSDGESASVPTGDPVVFAVATTDTSITIKNDGKNNMFFTFQLLITNGYARIKADEHGRAMLQDMEDFSGSESKGSVATIMFNAATSDLQLFDREGNLIDQANLPTGIYNNGEFVTVRNRQNIYGEKIWADPEDVLENANTLYELSGDDTAYGVFIGRSLIEQASAHNADHFIYYLQNSSDFGAHVFSLSEEDGICFTRDQDRFPQNKLAQPSVRDFFNISEDRDVNTLEDIGDDSVVVCNVEALSTIQALRLWQGYSQVALIRRDVQDALAIAYIEFIDGYDPTVSYSDLTDNGESAAWLVSRLYDIGVISSDDMSLDSAKAELSAIRDGDPEEDETIRTKRALLANECARIFPHKIGLDDESAIEDVIGIPTVAVLPEDIRQKYTITEVNALKEKYEDLATQDNGLSNATADNLAEILRGIYEAQIEAARKAYIASDNAWRSNQGIRGFLHSVEISSEGITLTNERSSYRIHLKEGYKDGEGYQKIALSKMDGANAKTFAFIGDSGVLGGAPLFTVIIAAHAEMVEGISTWVLDSLSASDGFIPSLFAEHDDFEHGEGVNHMGKGDVFGLEDTNVLSVHLDPNLADLDFTHVSLDIQGITGVNSIPCEQFKHMNCIVPLYMNYGAYPGFFGERGCAVDVTEMLNSWVQTSIMPVQEVGGFTPDIIIVRGYGLKIQTTEPNIAPPFDPNH